MTATTSLIDLSLNHAIDSFDDYPYISVGEGSTVFNPGNASLVSEFYRNVLEDFTKDLVNGYYIFAIRIPATQNNGRTIAEVGVFSASSGGDMAIRQLLISTNLSVLQEQWIDILVQVNN